MASVFDRETLLDLVVNFIPLAIILFFVAAFLLFDPFPNLDTLGRVLQFGLLVVPFIALAVLTYLSGRAIAGAEQSGPAYLPGQAAAEDAQPEDQGAADAPEAVTDESPAETDVDETTPAVTRREEATDAPADDPPTDEE